MERLASDIASSDTPKTPLELKLESLGKFLGFIALIVAVLLVSIEMIIAYGNPKVDIWEAAVDQFIIAIAIFVAIVPEGLPNHSCNYPCLGNEKYGQAQGNYSYE